MKIHNINLNLLEQMGDIDHYQNTNFLYDGEDVNNTPLCYIYDIPLYIKECQPGLIFKDIFYIPQEYEGRLEEILVNDSDIYNKYYQLCNFIF